MAKDTENDKVIAVKFDSKDNPASYHADSFNAPCGKYLLKLEVKTDDVPGFQTVASRKVSCP
ncbi:MAG: hypothetical protein ACU837_09215 [Gammaproteobacteria bacterium]